MKNIVLWHNFDYCLVGLQVYFVCHHVIIMYNNVTCRFHLV